MRTQSQIEASRRNGKLSRGPSTPIGLAHSSANSTKHGLLANTVFLPQEDKAAFDLLRADYMTEWDPHGPTETRHVRQLAMCEWREYRVSLLEASIVGVHAARRAFTGISRPPTRRPESP